jgi:pyrroloquinoline quinone biosynthesis protein B
MKGRSFGYPILILCASVALWCPFVAARGSATEPRVRAIVLGVAQDAGVPHIGCRQELCERARRDPRRRVRVASVGLVDEGSGARYLIDATPDLALQVEALPGRSRDRARPVDGILLTHAHIGHYAGLMYLGREALGARAVPVYATPRMAAFIRANGPWSLLASEGRIEVHEVEPGKTFALGERLQVTPLAVPHRDELSDTVGFRVQGPRRTLLYLPDIDKWEKWDRRLEDEVARADVALLDGTFFEAGEIPGRSQRDIPHPLVPETVERLAAPELARRVFFIHLNHTNRLLWDAPARRGLERRGFRVAREGQEEEL